MCNSTTMQIFKKYTSTTSVNLTRLSVKVGRSLVGIDSSVDTAGVDSMQTAKQVTMRRTTGIDDFITIQHMTLHMIGYYYIFNNLYCATLIGLFYKIIVI